MLGALAVPIQNVSPQACCPSTQMSFQGPVPKHSATALTVGLPAFPRPPLAAPQPTLPKASQAALVHHDRRLQHRHAGQVVDWQLPLLLQGSCQGLDLGLTGLPVLVIVVLKEGGYDFGGRLQEGRWVIRWVGGTGQSKAAGLFESTL